MKVIITGISSYLSKELFPFLENDDNITEILGIDLIKPNLFSKKLKFIKSDVRNPHLVNHFKDYDALIHLAFIVSPLKDKNEMYSINIEGSRNIFNCALKAGINQIVHASSVAAYGSFKDNPIPITEDHPIRLMDHPYYYHETKYRVEKYLDEFESQNPNIIITRLRPHIFLGPHINNTFKDIYKGKRIISFFPNRITQYVWAKDVAEAFYLALIKKKRGTFNIGADEPINTYQIADKLNKKILKLPYKLILSFVTFSYTLHITRKLDPGWIRMTRYPIIVDATKAKKLLDWQPKYTTFETIKKFINYMKEIGVY